MLRSFKVTRVTEKYAGYNKDVLKLENEDLALDNQKSTDFDCSSVASLQGVRKMPKKYTVVYEENKKGNIHYAHAYCTFIGNRDLHWNACFLEASGFKNNTRLSRYITEKED